MRVRVRKKKMRKKSKGKTEKENVRRGRKMVGGRERGRDTATDSRICESD